MMVVQGAVRITPIASCTRNQASVKRFVGTAGALARKRAAGAQFFERRFLQTIFALCAHLRAGAPAVPTVRLSDFSCAPNYVSFLTS